MLGLEEGFDVAVGLCLDVLEELKPLQLDFLVELLIDLVVFSLEQLLLLSFNLAQNLPLLPHLLLEILQPLEAVIAVVAEECAVGADALLVGNADDVHHHLVRRAQLLALPSTHIDQQLVVLWGWIGFGGGGRGLGFREGE